MGSLALESVNQSPTGIQRATRITGNDLPDDVWRLVAHYVLLEQAHDFRLARFISLNRTFFNFFLSAKYGEVRWFRLDKRFIRILERLQEPFIACYVQKLFIRAWFIDFLFKREELFHSTSVKSSWNRAGGISALARFTQDLFQSKTRLPNKSVMEFQRSWEAGKLIQGTSSKALVKMLVQAVSGMSNVTEFNFEWRDLPLNKHTAIFLTSTRTAFDTSLRKLVLRAQIPKFKELLAITNFDNIHELDLHFDYRSQGPGPASDLTKMEEGRANEESSAGTALSKDPDVEDLHNTVIPFISHRRAQLHTLSISSSADVDLSQFFDSLPPLFALRRFSIGLSFHKQGLSDPTGLLRVLQNGKSTLLHVSFEAEWPASTSKSNNPHTFTRESSLKQKRASWAVINTKLLSLHECLSGLESLKIPFVSLAHTLPIIRRSCDTLKCLSLNDYFLSKEELSALSGVFAHRLYGLEHLHIEVAYLDLTLMELLASRFPGLVSLVLVYQEFEYLIPNTPIEHTAIPDWKLSYVRVYGERYRAADDDYYSRSGVHALTEATIEKTFASWIPTLPGQKGSPRNVFL